MDTVELRKNARLQKLGIKNRFSLLAKALSFVIPLFSRQESQTREPLLAGKNRFGLEAQILIYWSSDCHGSRFFFLEKALAQILKEGAHNLTKAHILLFYTPNRFATVFNSVKNLEQWMVNEKHDYIFEHIWNQSIWSKINNTMCSWLA